MSITDYLIVGAQATDDMAIPISVQKDALLANINSLVLILEESLDLVNLLDLIRVRITNLMSRGRPHLCC